MARLNIAFSFICILLIHLLFLFFSQKEQEAIKTKVLIRVDQKITDKNSKKRKIPNEIEKKTKKISKNKSKKEHSVETDEKIEITDPVLISTIEKNYPYSSQINEEEGTVELLVQVNELGKSTDIKITKSSGYKDLDNEALRAIKKASFRPAKKENQNISGMIKLNIDFILE